MPNPIACGSYLWPRAIRSTSALLPSAMSNFGFFHLRVVNPYELVFREARSAVGAAPLLAKAQEFKTVAEAVEDCHLI